MIEEYLKKIDYINNKGYYKPTWESLTNKEVPKWFKEAKFGIFVHWGLYSIPAFANEWYSKNMYEKGSIEYQHHINTYGHHKNFGYKDFIPMFKAEKFKADDWINIFKESGAKYFFQVAEHHDGFQMYKSKISKWNSCDMGPKRDILGELKKSCEKKDIKFCVSSHRAEHWFFMSGGTKFESDIIKDNEKRGDFYWPVEEEKGHYDFFSKPYPSAEFLEDWLVRTVEIIDNYKPQVLYFDWWIQHDSFKPYLLKLIAYYYNSAIQWNKEVTVCYKHDALAFGSGVIEIERGKFKEAKSFYWQTDTAIAKNSWCYTNSLEYKTSYDIITNLIDIVSKNGNLLLNIGPKANGEIPHNDLCILKEIGEWLKLNGEGIYKSKPWIKSFEGQIDVSEGKFSENCNAIYTNKDIRFTTTNGAIYAFVLKYENQDVLIKSMKKGSKDNKEGIFSNIKNIEVLGFDEKVKYSLSDKGLYIKTTTIKSKLPVVFKIILE